MPQADNIDNIDIAQVDRAMMALPVSMQSMLQESKSYGMQQQATKQFETVKRKQKEDGQAEAKRKKQEETKRLKELSATCPIMMTDAWLKGIADVMQKVDKYEQQAAHHLLGQVWQKKRLRRTDKPWLFFAES